MGFKARPRKCKCCGGPSGGPGTIILTREGHRSHEICPKCAPVIAAVLDWQVMVGLIQPASVRLEAALPSGKEGA